MANVEAIRDMEPIDKRAANEALQSHAKKPKKSVSVAGLFAKKPRASRDKLDSTNDGTRISRSAEDEITARAKRHPVYLDVKEAAAAYSEGDARSVTEQLDAVRDELTAMIEGMHVNGKPLDIPGLPSQSERQNMQEDPALFQPLRDDVVTVSVSKPDGTTALKHVKLGDSMQKLEKLIDDTEAKTTRWAEEIGEIDEDILAVLEEYKKATKTVNDAYDEKLAVFHSDVHAYHQSVVEEITKARKEDKAYSVEANRKLQEFAASLI